MYCDYCKRKFRKIETTVSHINIFQDNPYHLFCSKRCKEAWQKDVFNCSLRKIIVWDIDITTGKCFFKKGAEYEYISPFASKFSFFSENFGEVSDGY